MKKLLFMLLICSLLTSCSKEDITPKKDYTLYSADVTIYLDNQGGFITVPLHSFKDIVLEKGNFYLIPNTNCPESIGICAGIRFINIKSFSLKNKLSYQCR